MLNQSFSTRGGLGSWILSTFDLEKPKAEGKRSELTPITILNSIHNLPEVQFLGFHFELRINTWEPAHISTQTHHSVVEMAMNYIGSILA